MGIDGLRGGGRGRDASSGDEERGYDPGNEPGISRCRGNGDGIFDFRAFVEESSPGFRALLDPLLGIDNGGKFVVGEEVSFDGYGDGTCRFGTFRSCAGIPPNL